MEADELTKLLGGPLDEALSRSPEVALGRLGAEVLPLGAFPPKASECVDAGRRWLRQRRVAICAACSKHEEVSDYMKGGRSYKIGQICAILVDLIAAALRLPTAGAAWASVALLQLGLDQFCAGVCLPEPTDPRKPE